MHRLHISKIHIFICCILLICIFVAVYFWGTGWLLAVIPVALSFFTDEIKELVSHMFNSFFQSRNRIRVVCAYAFRIKYANTYLLVKDEHGQNTYGPVGGVYKYYPEQIDIGIFNGEYDGRWEYNDDTENDLRLIIGSDKESDFFTWFDNGNIGTESQRENAENLSREFYEELLETHILPAEAFPTIKYDYIGTQEKKEKNFYLGMRQVEKHQVFNLILKGKQLQAVSKLIKVNSASYIFATREDILVGKMIRNGSRFDISEASKLILVAPPSLKKESALKGKQFSAVMPFADSAK